MNNTGTKYFRIMKQTAFWREKIGEYIPCLKYSVPIFVEYIYIYIYIYIYNVNNTGTKYVRIMKQTEFWREKIGEYIPCLKYSVPIFVQYIYKVWIIQEPNTLELWNKLHFEEKKNRRVYTMFKIFSTYICWINI